MPLSPVQLTPVQARIMGCLVEKERATPDNYPLTMNSLILACNQTTSRFPVVTFSEAVVSNAIENLKGDNLVRIDFSRSNRAERYRQVLEQALDVDDGEISLLAVLMLRGPQTAGELRTRTERLHPFASQDDVEAVLGHLAARPEPLVVRLRAMAGQKEPRWAHLLSGDVSVDDLPAPPTSDAARTSRTERIESLEATVAELAEEVARLRADHDALSARLEPARLEPPPLDYRSTDYQPDTY